MPQNNLHILCTRPLDQQLIDKAARHHLQVSSAAFIETEPVTAPALAETIRQLSSANIVAVFTSMNAVESVTRQLTAPAAWQIFCMGGITREAVVDFFGPAAIAGTARNATLLAEKILSQQNIQKLFFFCGDQRLDELPESLRRQQVEVEEVVVYTTIQTPQLVEQDYDGILFFSPSAVHSFFSVNTIPTKTILFAIGKTTAATIQTYCSNKVVTSEWPGREQMMERVIQYFSNSEHLYLSPGHRHG